MIYGNRLDIIGIYPMVADILHAGHILAIEEAKKHCDVLIVALHCCPTYKKPLQSIYERFIQLEAVKGVDGVIPYENRDDMERLLRSYDYDVYFLGDDYYGKDFECKEVLEELGKEIIYLKRNHDMSSTRIKNLALDYEVSTMVKKGDKK